MIIEVGVRPNSGRSEVEKVGDGKYKVFLKKSPEDGRANDEMIKLLKKEFGMGDVKIIRGKTSRKKVVEVVNAN